MANTTRQTSIFGIEDWKQIYQTYQEADFQSYDFETIRKSFVDYIRTYYPESFNDFVESSEFVALLDVMAFMGQSLAFRNELNARENFLETAERRESVVKLAELVSYTPKRNEAATGLLKLQSVSTTENVIDYNGNNLSAVSVVWDDSTNPDWYEQMVAIINAALVNSQRIGRPGATNNILDISTAEYTINAVPGTLPVRPFSARINGISMPFELVSASVKGTTLSEVPPTNSGLFNMLFRNDKLGFASPDTGFFFMFKQGELVTRDFNIKDRISNRIIDLDVVGVNNNDVWVFSADAAGAYTQQWQKVDNLVNLPSVQGNTNKKYFSVSSTADDKVSLLFGDGVFAEVPVGALRAYTRSSNGLEYVINPVEMSSVTISFPYVSRTNRVESITFTLSLETAVSNAASRESIAAIKNRAPARYYTQNRMVNGEDYTNFPFAQFASIIKSKAVNRTSIGASRYLDLVDVTGKYSSSNVFGSDGVLYRALDTQSFTFSWQDLNDIASIIVNQLEPAVHSRGMTHYYYAVLSKRDRDNNPYRINVATNNLVWEQRTFQYNEATGYFRLGSGAPQTIGVFASDNRRYLTESALVKFVAPIGSYFTDTNLLVAGVPPAGQNVKEYIWATITRVVGDGSNQGQGSLDDGSGPVSLSVFVPAGAIPTEIIPLFVSDLPADVEQQITLKISRDERFGLTYDHTRGLWEIVAIDENDSNIFVNRPELLIAFTFDGSTYTVTYRTLNYYFASIKETRFYYDGTQQVYDSKTGTVVNDYVRLLKINSQPGQSIPLSNDVLLDIVGQPAEADGYINDFRVSISFTDTNHDGIADDPDFFDGLVSDELVFFRATKTQDNLTTILPLVPGAINTSYDNVADISLAIYNYDIGTLFYTKENVKVYEIVSDVNGSRSLKEYAVITDGVADNTTAAEFMVYTGRYDLQFHYRHNSPTSRRIDPGTTNIVDLYVVTDAYYKAYQKYLRDSTNTVREPLRPTINELTAAYSQLNQYKMVSDNIVLNSVVFKPLFGNKAVPELQAAIKVVRNQKTLASDSEIKTKVLQAINDFFTIDKWNFGDTFYFTELSAFLHKEVGDLISSAVVVPRNALQKFGDLFEVRAAPNEIFVSAATVNDIEVIDTITNGNIRVE